MARTDSRQIPSFDTTSVSFNSMVSDGVRKVKKPLAKRRGGVKTTNYCSCLFFALRTVAACDDCDLHSSRNVLGFHNALRKSNNYHVQNEERFIWVFPSVAVHTSVQNGQK